MKSKRSAILCALLLTVPFLVFAQRTAVQTGPNRLGGPTIGYATIVVRANVSGAQIFIDAVHINGNAARLQTGQSYTVTVRAPGYQDYVTIVTLTQDIEVFAQFQPQLVPLSVQGNVSGAQVFINGNPAGTVPFNSAFAPGIYTVVVRAPGFSDYSATVTLDRAQSVMFQLQPIMAQIELRLPPQYESAGGSDHRVIFAFFIDGQRVNGFMTQVTAGPHLVRVVADGLQSEVQLSCNPGQSYVIQPSLLLNIQ
jgi:hypothetical protein